MKKEIEYIPLDSESENSFISWCDTIMVCIPFIVIGALFILYITTIL